MSDIANLYAYRLKANPGLAKAQLAIGMANAIGDDKYGYSAIAKIPALAYAGYAAGEGDRYDAEMMTQAQANIKDKQDREVAAAIMKNAIEIGKHSAENANEYLAMTTANEPDNKYVAPLKEWRLSSPITKDNWMQIKNGHTTKTVHLSAFPFQAKLKEANPDLTQEQLDQATIEKGLMRVDSETDVSQPSEAAKAYVAQLYGNSPETLAYQYPDKTNTKQAIESGLVQEQGGDKLLKEYYDIEKLKKGDVDSPEKYKQQLDYRRAGKTTISLAEKDKKADLEQYWKQIKLITASDMSKQEQFDEINAVNSKFNLPAQYYYRPSTPQEVSNPQEVSKSNWMNSIKRFLGYGKKPNVDMKNQKGVSATGGGKLPGAKQAPDGLWYVPDPNRPGKYLRVD